MDTLNVNEILARLGPTSPPGVLYNIFLYIIFILAIIVMFMQSDKQTITTVMMGGVAGLAVIAKLSVFPNTDFGALVVNAGMFVFPLITAGVTKAKKSVPLAVICGIFAGIFFFMFWFFLQRS